VAGRRTARRRKASPSLSDREALVLNAIDRPACGLDVKAFVETEHGIPMPFGSLYVMLSRLVARGLAKRVGAPPGAGEDAGSRLTAEYASARSRAARRQYYVSTDRGADVLRAKIELLAPLIAVLRGSPDE
jgi:hypothetical protein